MFKKILNLVKACSKRMQFNEREQFINTIRKDMDSACQQNSLLSSSFKTSNRIINNCVSKTLKINPILTREKPQLKLEEINIVEKEKKVIR